MRLLVTGATGFVGKQLLPRLRAAGHEVTALVRDPARAAKTLGADITLSTDLAGAVNAAEGVINLAGEPIGGRRWNAAIKAKVRQSRVELTQQLVRAMQARPPRLFVSGSAVGYYGERGDQLLTEQSPPGDDFLAHVCLDWEAAARAAEPLGTRVVVFRTGVVLGRGGGALASMLPSFRVGLGGRLGTGRQYMPWIHLDDVANAITAAVGDERYRGPLNLTAPELVTNAQLSATLGRVLSRPAVVPVPVFALRLLFGEAADVLIASARVQPEGLEKLGYAYRYPTLEAALRHAVP